MKTAFPLGAGRLRRPSAKDAYQAARRFFVDGLVLFGSLLLFLFYIVPIVLRPTVLVAIPNVLTMSVTIVTGSLLFLGMPALRRTPLDGLFLVWMAMATVSHFHATTVLSRQLLDTSLFTYIAFIMTFWAAYRASYAMIKLTPRFAPIALLISLLFVLTCSALLGILQGVGPVKQAAFEFAGRFTDATHNLLEGAEVGRPTGVFAGPNILGYADNIGALCLFAIGASYARTSKPWHVLLIMVGLGVFGYSTLLAQSRTSLVIYVLTVAAYGLALRRGGASRGSLATFSVLFFTVGFVGLTAFQFAKLNYVENTFSSDIAKDGSYLVRQKALGMAADIAVEVAPFGTGVGQINQVSMMVPTGYDKYWTIAVDNEWVNLYLTHGVWGPLFLAAFYLFAFRSSLPALRSHRPEARLFGLLTVSLLVITFFLGFTAVRIAKYDTGIFIAVLVGAATASGDEPLEPIRQRPLAQVPAA